MEQIIITKRDGSRVPMANRHTATTITSAKQSWTLNGDDVVDIVVTSPFRQSYDIGDQITVFGRVYTLNQLPKPVKNGMHDFQYTLKFEGVQYDLLRASYDVTIDTTNNELQDIQGDSLTGNMGRFLTVLVSNANRVFPGKWKLGTYPDTDADVTLTFGEDDNCLSVLQSLMTKFGDDEYTFEIVKDEDGVYTINVGKEGSTLPIKLEFGKGNGLYNLSRDNVDSSNIVTRLKVYGSTDNITAKYRADRLCLPEKSKSQSFIEKDEPVSLYGIFEARKNFDSIKPTFTGKVEALGDTIFEFIDTSLFDLNALDDDGATTKYLIDGTAAKVHFNTGNLAGYEFEINKYDHATHKITLKKLTDDRGNVFPSDTSEAFQIGEKNEYKLLDIAYPAEINEAAEKELLEKGNTYYDQNCQPKVQYSLTVTKMWLESKFGTDVSTTNVFSPGDYIPIKDEDIDVDKAVKIKTIQRNVLDPYDYSLTISDTITKSVTTRVISDLIDIDKILEFNDLKDPARARANWRTSQELLNMVFDPEGDYYTDKIKPNSIETLALSVGAKSMQFGLTNTVFEPNYNGDPNVLAITGGVLTHYTINEDAAVSWIMADATLEFETDDALYIYAKCERNGQGGYFVVGAEQHKVTEDANYYYFWVGVLNSVDKETNVRAVSLSYGFTTINGRYIKTGRIQSSGDGVSYFDLDSNIMVLGDKLDYNSKQDGVLRLKGTIVQSSSGDESPLPCFRGVYNAKYTYYPGDTVIYDPDGGTHYSLYLCVLRCTGIAPDNYRYWQLQAAAGTSGADGLDGVNGDWVTYVFIQSETKPETPTSALPMPTGWSDAPTATGKWWMSKATVSGTTGLVVGGWSEPVQVTAEDGVDGAYTDFKYQKNNSSTEYPEWNPDERDPGGDWTDEPPSLESDEYLWMIQADIYADDTLKTPWSTPVRISGENGSDGVNGVGTRLVYRYYIGQPPVPTGTALTPTGWMDTPDKETFGITYDDSDWEQDADGFYKSPTIEDNGITTQRIRFTTTKANQQIIVQAKVSSESKFDWLLMGKLDTEGLTRTANFAERISGDGVTAVWYLSIPTVGEHFVDIAFAKDGSTSSYNDCGYFRIIDTDDCWISFGTVAADGKVASWSTPKQFLTDNASEEYIYLLMKIKETPTTPVSDAYVDDYVPDIVVADYDSETTYNTGQLARGENGKVYAAKKDGVSVVPVTKTTLANGLETYLVNTFYWEVFKPNWTDNPQDVSTTYRYQYESKRTKVDGKWGAFSTPVLWNYLPEDGKTGATGDAGQNGDYYEFRYNKSGSTTKAPDIDTSSRNPGDDWTTEMPTVSVGYYLWMTCAKISGTDDSLLSDWTTPVRVSGEKGDTGAAGKSPVMVFRGDWSAEKTYYGTENRLDCVKYTDGAYFIAQITAGTITAGTLPTDTSKWNPFGASFESVATELLLAEFAYIENLGVRDLKTAESGRRVHISSQENAMTVYDDDDSASIQIAGKTVTDAELFGGANVTVQPTNVDKTFNFTTSNQTATNTASSKSFSFENEGNFDGSFTLQLSGTVNTGTNNTGTTQISKSPSATLKVLLDGNIELGSVTINYVQIGGGFPTAKQDFTFSQAISKGQHIITVVLTTNSPYFYSGGSMSITAKATFGECKATADIRKSLYFANGNAVGCSSSQYVETVIESSLLNHKVEAGKVGIHFNNGVMKIKLPNGTGETWYTVSRDTSTGALILTP